MALEIEEITRLFETYGAQWYGGEGVDQLQHALQCAHRAEQAGATPELMVAALLHDLGHLLQQHAPDGRDDVHQYAVVPFLRGLFPSAVIDPIRLHVDAKRYLCATDSAYAAQLSEASVASLALQGGPFSSEQAQVFLTQPFAVDALALRRWDDLAKSRAAQPPGWAHYLPVLESVSLRD
jgi:phosphonate degradation associated HDIG domain protein